MDVFVGTFEAQPRDFTRAHRSNQKQLNRAIITVTDCSVSERRRRCSGAGSSAGRVVSTPATFAWRATVHPTLPMDGDGGAGEKRRDSAFCFLDFRGRNEWNGERCRKM